jgi:hypothetical protein
MSKRPRQLSDAQWAYIWEFADTFDKFISLAVERSVPGDEFDQYLYLWGFSLAALAHNVYTGSMELIKSDNLRSAFILSRSLLEYDTRLEYYVQQAKPIVEAYRANPTKNIKNVLKQLKAVRDLQNAWPKLMEPLKIRPLDLDDLTEKERQDLIARLQRVDRTFNQSMEYMLKTITSDAEQFGMIYSTYLVKSSYSHGDQAIIPDVLQIKPESFDITTKSEKMSPFHVASETIAPTLKLWLTLENLLGCDYGGCCWMQHAAKLF